MTHDLRILCGMDVRRTGLWPDDEARAEMLARRYGGTITTYPVGLAAVCFEWRHDDQVVTVTGSTAADALGQLASRMTGDA